MDEYQDTNHAQYRLVRALAEPQRNVVAVGDDDQGIYSWRGRRRRNILDFERDYPDAHVVALEQNYRSTGTILRAANAVVERNPHRHPKRLWTDLGDGEPIAVVSCRDEHEEARVVAGEIDRALARGDSLSDIAVFYRTNAQSRAIEDQLVRRGVALRRGRRPPLLRARRGPRPARLPARGRQPGRRGEPGADAGRAQARHRARARSPSWRRSPRRTSCRWPTPCCAPTRCRACRPASAPPSPPRAPCSATCASASAAGPPLDRILEEVLERSGLREALRARGHLRGPGADREPRGDGARGGRVRGRPRRRRPSPASWRGSPCRPTPTWSTESRGAGHADDDPQRQGPRVRHRRHHRARGGAVPARRARTPPRRSRRSGASSTWASRGRGAT